MSEIFKGIFQSSLKTGIVIFVLLLLNNKFDRRYSAKSKVRIWLMVSLYMIFPIKLPFEKIMPHMPAAIQYQTIQHPNVGRIFNIPMSIISEKTNTIDVMKVLVLGWIIGILILWLYNIIVYGVWRRKIVLNVSKYKNSMCYEILELLYEELHIQKHIPVLVSKSINSPILFGFLKTAIILPEKDFTYSELYYSLKHELIHYIHKDSWKKLWLLYVNIIHWFNPLCWIMRQCAEIDMEKYCDDTVMEGCGFIERKRYCEILLRALENANKQTIFTENLSGGVKIMKNRIQNIVKPARKKSILISTAVFFALMVLSSMTFGEELDKRECDAVNILNIQAVVDNQNETLAKKRYDMFTEGVRYISYSVYGELSETEMEEIGKRYYNSLSDSNGKLVKECSMAFYKDDGEELIYSYIYNENGVMKDKEGAYYVPGNCFSEAFIN